MSSTHPQSEPEEPEFKMTLDMNILQHLGLKMYTSLPAVISEYVANAWDAWATEVEITVPTEESMSEDYEIVIEDNGMGMSYEEVEEKFLVVGRNRREDEGTDVTEKGGETRQVMGRKGIGKLAGFGVAGLVRVKTFKDNKWVEFELDYADMKEEGNEDDPAETSEYEPDITGWGTDGDKEHGTIVTLTDLERERRPTLHYITQRLARRFSVHNADFTIEVNNEEVDASDRGLKGNCKEVWEFEETIVVDREGHELHGEEFELEGWIGAEDDPVDDEQNGVAVMARNKLVQEPSLFDAPPRGPGEYTYRYLLGEVHADFVDDEDLDLISTNRSSLAWGKEPATTLHDWIEDELVEVAVELDEIKFQEAIDDARETKSYDERITSLPDDQQEQVDEFIAENAKDRDFEEGEEDPFLEKVAESTQREAFTDFIADIREVQVSDPEEVMDLFHQWEILDALELMQVARGRLETITKFRELMETGASDEQFVHEFISDNPWVLEPRWNYVDNEPEYTDQLQEKYPAEELHNDPENRLELLCLGYGESLNIVEILKPDGEITRRNLENLELYVDELREEIQSDEENYRGVNGYVIGGTVSDSAEQKVNRLQGDEIFARTYEQMQEIAENTFEQFMQVFEDRAVAMEDDRLMREVEELKDDTVTG